MSLKNILWLYCRIDTYNFAVIINAESLLSLMILTMDIFLNKSIQIPGIFFKLQKTR